MNETAPHVVNVDEVEEVDATTGDRWGHLYKPLTPAMGQAKLGANLTRVPSGRAAGAFHAHQRDDEIFYVLSGRGVFRYGDSLQDIRPGDCVACPAGTGVAHQFANPFEEDLVYLAIGQNDPDEVCVYPDSGKVMVRSFRRIGYLEQADRYEGEPDVPKIFELAGKHRSKK